MQPVTDCSKEGTFLISNYNSHFDYILNVIACFVDLQLIKGTMTTSELVQCFQISININ